MGPNYEISKITLGCNFQVHFTFSIRSAFFIREEIKLILSSYYVAGSLQIWLPSIFTNSMRKELLFLFERQGSNPQLTKIFIQRYLDSKNTAKLPIQSPL